MKPVRLLLFVVSLIVLLALVFLLANFFVGSGSTNTVVEVARSRCVQDGFPAKNMLAQEILADNGLFGFGGRATVTLSADVSFGPDGKRKMEPLILRVQLGRRMNLSNWEVLSVGHEP
jgi:hypothetical protein